MPDLMEPNDWENKLSVRAQQLLSKLRSEISNLRSEVSNLHHGERELDTENERLRAALEGKYESPEWQSDNTFLVNEDTGTPIPLGKSPCINFADVCTVYYGPHDESSGAPVLVIETDAPMQIQPTSNPGEIIIITRA